MKKIIALAAIAASVIAAGCTPRAEDVGPTFTVRPKELADCSFHYLTNTNGQRLTVVRCPNSTTSTTVPSGKSTQTVVTVDGVEYVRKE